MRLRGFDKTFVLNWDSHHSSYLLPDPLLTVGTLYWYFILESSRSLSLHASLKFIYPIENAEIITLGTKFKSRLIYRNPKTYTSNFLKADPLCTISWSSSIQRNYVLYSPIPINTYILKINYKHVPDDYDHDSQASYTCSTSWSQPRNLPKNIYVHQLHCIFTCRGNQPWSTSTSSSQTIATHQAPSDLSTPSSLLHPQLHPVAPPSSSPGRTSTKRHSWQHSIY